MTKLKPQLIITGSNKKKGGLGGTIGYLLTLILVFAVGVYVGMQVNSSDFHAVDLSGISQNRDPEADIQMREDLQPVKEVIEDNKLESDIDVVSSNTDTENNILNSDKGLSGEPLIQQDDNSNENQQLSDTESPLSDVTSVDLNNTLPNTQDSAVLSSDTEEPDVYRLQVAAFEDIYDANAAVSKLQEKGYDAYVVQSTNSRGESWNLIKVGKFKTAQEAWNYSASYQDQEGGEVIVESLQRGRVYNESLEENLPQ